MYLKNGIVVKCHSCQKGGLRREAAALRTLHAAGLAVPRLLRCTEHCLFLEYIAGTTYADLSEAITFREAAALAHWLAAYHRLTNELRGGDVNLRNFLWTGTECFGGVDFEDPPAVGDQETDQGRIIAFAATYDPPPFSANKIRCAEFFFCKLFCKREVSKTKYAAPTCKKSRPYSKGEAQCLGRHKAPLPFFAEIEGRL